MTPNADSIKVHLPDGSIKEFPAGSTPLDVAQSISPRLAAAAIVARIRPAATNGSAKDSDPTEAAEEAPLEAGMYAAEEANVERLVDLSTPLKEDMWLQLLTEKDADALKIVRHSAAHVMATAVLELYPETKLGHGPATDAGFFYDFYRPTPFTPEDLKAIEAKMAEVVARDEPFRPRMGAAGDEPGALQGGQRFHEGPLRRTLHQAGRGHFLLPQRQV